jgi:hypothetical protein
MAPNQAARVDCWRSRLFRFHPSTATLSEMRQDRSPDAPIERTECISRDCVCHCGFVAWSQVYPSVLVQNVALGQRRIGMKFTLPARKETECLSGQES